MEISSACCPMLGTSTQKHGGESKLQFKPWKRISVKIDNRCEQRKEIDQRCELHREIICKHKACRFLLFLTFISATLWVEEEITPKNKIKEGVGSYGIERIVSVEGNRMRHWWGQWGCRQDKMPCSLPWEAQSLVEKFKLQNHCNIWEMWAKSNYSLPMLIQSWISFQEIWTLFIINNGLSNS